MSERSTQQDIRPAVLAEFRARLEQEKKCALRGDQMDAALAMKDAVNAITQLQQNQPSAADVLAALEAHKEVIGAEWFAGMYSLVPCTSSANESPAKRSRTV